MQRWSLEDAALKVKVSKKSLDDYLLQLRFGKKFGFEFAKYRDEKVGKLRCFVKEEKKKQKDLMSRPLAKKANGAAAKSKKANDSNDQANASGLGANDKNNDYADEMDEEVED